MKRLLLFLLVVLLVVPVLPTAAKTEISYYAFWTGNLDPDSFCEKLVEEGTGYDIVVRKVEHTNSAAVQLMIATEMPDCGWFSMSYEWMDDQELIRNIPVALVKEHFPGYIELCDKYPLIYDIALDPEDNTQFRFLPEINTLLTDVYVPAMYVRYDWLQKLGIELDGVAIEQVDDRLFIGDKGITLADFEKVLDAFVNQDPDGNGQKDTFGLLKDWPDILAPAFDLIMGNMEVDGKLGEWITHPHTKDMLAWMQDMYKRGLVYPEIFTIAWGADWELINKSQAGLWSGGAVSTTWLNSWASNRPPLTLFAGNPDAKLLMLPGIRNQEGLVPRYRYTSPAGGQRFYVNADVNDEKIVDILKFLNFCYFSDKQVMAQLWFGEENVDWVWGEDGKPKKTSDIINGMKGTQVFCRNLQFGEVETWISFEPLFSKGGKYYVQNEGGLWLAEGRRYPYKEDIYLQTKASEISNEYGKDWSDTRNAYFLGVITGEKNLEGDWDSYIKALDDTNYFEYLTELDKAPKIADLLAKYE